MRVHIINMDKNIIYGSERDTFDAYSVSFDPEKRYAVIELFANELFIAAKVTAIEDDLLTAEYVNYYRGSGDNPSLEKYTVYWSTIKYGFCKLDLFAPEQAYRFDGFFSGTVARFYFDWDLYVRCYEELNGVPCRKKNPNIRKKYPNRR